MKKRLFFFVYFPLSVAVQQPENMPTIGSRHAWSNVVLSGIFWNNHLPPRIPPRRDTLFTHVSPAAACLCRSDFRKVSVRTARTSSRSERSCYQTRTRLVPQPRRRPFWPRPVTAVMLIPPYLSTRYFAPSCARTRPSRQKARSLLAPQEREML